MDISINNQSAESLALRCLANGQRVLVTGQKYSPIEPYIIQHGGEIRYVDAAVRYLELPWPDWADVIFLGQWDDSLYGPYKIFSHLQTIIDPWHRLAEHQSSGGIIYPGINRQHESRDRAIADVALYTSHIQPNFVEVWPVLQDRTDILYMLAWEELTYSIYHHMPGRPVEEIVSEIREAYVNGKTTVLFDLSGEAVLTDCLHKIQVIMRCMPDIDPKVFLVTSAINVSDAYKVACVENNWAQHINILSYNRFEFAIQKHITRMLEETSASVSYKICDKKKFVCMNKVARGHRVYLLGKLFEYDLLDDAYWSFQENIPLSHFIDVPERDQVVRNQIELNQYRLPMNLNATPNRNNPVDLIPHDLEFHDDSYFSVVTETMFYKDDTTWIHKQLRNQSLYTVFLTEKTFRPVAFKHPFILLSVPYSIKTLKDMGYKTFHPYINESYDIEEDDDKRMDMIIAEIRRLCAFTREQWMSWQVDIKEIVEYNYDVMLSKSGPEHAYNNLEI